jgi:hypothetical protein
VPPFVVGSFDYRGLGPLLALAFFGPVVGGIFLDSWVHTFPAFMFAGFFAVVAVFLVHAKDFRD